MKQCECYIEEYCDGKKARLRDKKTNIKVSFQANTAEQADEFLRFLSSAKLVHLDIYNQNSNDYVFVEGNCISEGGDEIVFSYDNKLSYCFK